MRHINRKRGHIGCMRRRQSGNESGDSRNDINYAKNECKCTNTY